MKLKLLALVMLNALAIPSYGSEPQNSGCFQELSAPLAAGQYSGELDCKKISATLRKVGNITNKEKTFEVYNLVYKTLETQGAPSRGGQKNLLLSNKNYIGQYPLNPPPSLKIAQALVGNGASPNEVN